MRSVPRRELMLAACCLTHRSRHFAALIEAAGFGKDFGLPRTDRIQLQL